jgi:homoserine kinase
VLCVPDGRQSTTAARGVLPEAVSLGDAAANGARTAMVLAGLSGSIAWEPSVMHDVLHEPARFGVMSASGSLVTSLRDRGIGACLSGAGPTVLAIVEVDDAAAIATVRSCVDDGWEVRPGRWHRRGASRFNVADRPTVGTPSW